MQQPHSLAASHCSYPIAWLQLFATLATRSTSVHDRGSSSPPDTPEQPSQQQLAFHSNNYTECPHAAKLHALTAAGAIGPPHLTPPPTALLRAYL
eukprot:1160768-Pelagomonas_calceolata.AAC.2